jgi:probable HAF family extracellular repeat protein
VGQANTGGGATHAFSYSGGVMTDLGTLGGSSSVALAINGAGTIAGQASTSGGATHAMSYSGGVMTDLGTLGGSYSLASGINSSGTIVGYSYLVGNTAYHPFIYSGGVMTDLEPYLASIGMTGNGGATALDDNGNIIGYGTLGSGDTHGFLLTVPEPSALALLAFGLTALLARRRKGK